MTKLMYRVPYADTDQMKVVYYANYFVYFERLRNELLRDNGLSYAEMEQRDLAMPVIDAYCHYSGSARYDELIEISGKITEITKVKIRIEYEIRCGGKLLVTGYTVNASVSMKTGRPCRLPDELLKLKPETKA